MTVKKDATRLPRGDGGAPRIAKGEPRHANGMRDLIGLAADIRQGDPFDAMRVDFELSCGTARLRANEAEFSLALRTCHVALRLTNCYARPHSHYRAVLAEGDVKVTSLETNDAAAGREASIGANVKAGVDARSGIAAALGLDGRLGARRKTATAAKRTVERRSRIDLVCPAGQDRWQVGDAVSGDARRADGRLLGAYFNEVRDGAGDPVPLCVVQGEDADVVAEIEVSAIVRSGQLIVSLADQPASLDQVGDVEAALRQRGARAAKAQATAAADLRERVAGLVLAKEMLAGRRDDAVLSRADILVARQTLVATAPAGGTGKR